MQTHEMKIQEGIVSYYECGDNRNPTIFCLHGLAGNGGYSFGDLIPRLKDHFHLIILDSPGHGKTSPFLKESDYLFSNLAMWVKKIVEQVIEWPFYILGHSWGADAALHFTRFYPEKVLGLILLDGGFTFPQNQPEMTFDYAYGGWDNYMNQSVFNNEEEIFQEYQTYTSQWDSCKEKYTASLFKKRQDGKFELITSKFTVLSIIKAFFKEPFAEAYPFIKVPTFLIHAALPATMDEARTRGIHQMRLHIEDVSIQVIEDSSHMIQWDNPEKTGSLITNWINEKMIL